MSQSHPVPDGQPAGAVRVAQAGSFAEQYGWAPQPPPQPVPTPPGPGRRSPAAKVGAALVTVVAALAGFVGVRWVTTGLLPAFAPAAVATNAAGTDHSGDLRSLLLARPAGARACANLPTSDEQLTAEQEAAVSNPDKPTARAVSLKKSGFRRGALRCWIAADNTVVLVSLLQFDTVAHAVTYNVLNQRAVAHDYGKGTDVDAAAGVPGARVFRGPPQPQLPGYAVIDVMAQRGDIVVDIGLAQPGTVAPATINEAIRGQYDRL